MDTSEAALARAHALRALASRFPPAVEAALRAEDKATLHSIRVDHTKHLLASVRQLTEALKPVAQSGQNAQDAGPYADWQTGTEAVLGAAQTVDRSLTNALAGSGAMEDPDAALKGLAAAAGDLQASAAALQDVVARSGVR
jgi:hypothetical protein